MDLNNDYTLNLRRMAMNVIYMSAVVISASAYITCGPYKSKKVREWYTYLHFFHLISNT